MERPSDRGKPRSQGKAGVTLDPCAHGPPALTPQPPCLVPNGLGTAHPDPTKLQVQHIPSPGWPRRERAGLPQVPGLGKRAGEEKEFTLLSIALENCLSRAQGLWLGSPLPGGPGRVLYLFGSGTQLLLLVKQNSLSWLLTPSASS